jgi:predicted nucleotidyltransferase
VLILNPIDISGGAAAGWVARLERELGADWTAIRKARVTTEERRASLRRAFEGKIAADTSLVAFGSIAREEMTSDSDADWILLVDGQAQPEHSEQRNTIASELMKLRFPEPGRSGVFGCMIGSHDIVHEIGGEDDTNSNTTRRVLLLLESLPVGNREAYDRVRRQILKRYLNDDRGLTRSSSAIRVPRFLLNDLTRYWRTVTVDFVYKQRAEAGDKWALRNAKLRMSRKLVFASGLLRCFFCQLAPEAATAREHLTSPRHDISRLLTYMEGELAQTPLELLARAALRPSIGRDTQRDLFDSYNRFLGILDDQEKRDALKSMTEAEMATSAVWDEIRTISHAFHSGLRAVFFGNDEELRELTIDYGVF